MAFYISLAIFILLCVYLAIAYVRMSACGKNIKRRRAELTKLFIDRANLMPRLLNAARKVSPVPDELYGAYARAKRRFADAKGDAEIFSSNEELSAIFADVFKHYTFFNDAEINSLHAEYLGMLEKIGFTAEFYNNAVAERRQMNDLFPYRPAAVFFRIINKMLDLLYAFCKRTALVIKGKIEARRKK